MKYLEPWRTPTYYIVGATLMRTFLQESLFGVAISFAVDFASHILNEKVSLPERLWDDDDEITDEVEFSDDEKEAYISAM